MQILTIDTSQEDGYVALYEGEKLLASLKISSKMQTASLLQKIDILLKKWGFTLNNIDIFAVCTGPGSFTGTRIGVITAKTLGFAKSKRVIGFSSFIGRTPPIAFLGKRKIATPDGDDIIYSTVDDPEAVSKRELDLSVIGIHVAKKASSSMLENEEETNICYPKTL